MAVCCYKHFGSSRASCHGLVAVVHKYSGTTSPNVCSGRLDDSRVHSHSTDCANKVATVGELVSFQVACMSATKPKKGIDSARHRWNEGRSTRHLVPRIEKSLRPARPMKRMQSYRCCKTQSHVPRLRRHSQKSNNTGVQQDDATS